jgi:biopolymer transport protein ExbD
MQFANRTSVRPLPNVLPLLGVAIIPPLLVLALACFSLGSDDELTRLPGGTYARPPAVRHSPAISVLIDRQGGLILAGERVADRDAAAIWHRERAALQLLGLAPSQAAIAIRADAGVPTERVQQVLEHAQAAGFGPCVLQAMDAPSSAAGERMP